MAGPDAIVIDRESVNDIGLSILNDEIVVCERAFLHPGNRMSAFNISSSFSSFAGLFSETDNQDEWEDRFYPLGFATSKFDASGESPSNDGVSVRIKGSGTTTNTSDEILYPGDILAAQFPFLDAEKRVRQYHIMDSLPVPGAYSPVSKPVATIRKVTYADTLDSFKKVARVLVVNNSKISVPDYSDRVRNAPYSTETSRETQLATTLKMYNGVAGMSLVTSMIQHGLLVPTCPALANPLENDADLARWKAANRRLDQAGMGETTNVQWVPGPADDRELDALLAAITNATDLGAKRRAFREAAQTWSGRFETLNEADVDRRKVALESQIGTLAIIAGVASDPSKKKDLVENVVLTRASNTRVLFGSLGGLKNYARLRAIFFDTASSTATTRKNPFGNVIGGKKTPIAQLHTAYLEASPMFTHFMGKNFDHAYKFAMCMATSTAAPGEPVNYA
jgi:hypothetical protein